MFYTALLTRIAALLESGGWNALSIEDVWDAESHPRPAFVALSSQQTPIRIQIFIRRPARGGRLGADTVRRVAENAAALPGYEVLLSTDRGFTAHAKDVAKSFRSRATSPVNVHLVDHGGCLSFIQKHGGIRPQPVPANCVTYDAHVVVVGTVTPRLLERLAEDRLRLEEALRTGGPRFLEELVAENWRAEGYAVELVTRSNAPGPDVVATLRKSVVPIKVLTSCKWRSPGHAIKTIDIEELLSWVELVYPANAGLLATNSRLQNGALQLTQRFHRVHAMSGGDVVDWTLRLWRDGPGATGQARRSL